MGTDRTDYLMFGADMGVKDFDYDKHEDEINGAPGARFDIVYDGMCGQYCIAGKVIAKSEPYDGFEMAMIDRDKMLGIDSAGLAATISKSFGRPVSADDFKLILFSHFS